MDDPIEFAVADQLRRTRIAAVLILNNAQTAVQVAQALLAGGVSVIELTLRTNAALECVETIVAEVPGMTVGVGTILTEQQADAAKAAGATFGVAPATNPVVIRHAHQIDLPFAPGVMTPTDIDQAVCCGSRTLKFFPAEPAGGLPFLRSVAAPYRHLGLQFIPLGGITESNLATWLDEPGILAVGGSWLAPQAAVESGNWAAITQLARSASAIAQSRTPSDR